jgi:hypothetical protein
VLVGVGGIEVFVRVLVGVGVTRTTLLDFEHRPPSKVRFTLKLPINQLAPIPLKFARYVQLFAAGKLMDPVPVEGELE